MVLFATPRHAGHLARFAIACSLVLVLVLVAGLIAPVAAAPSRAKNSRGFAVTGGSVTEGDSGTRTIVFTVTMTGTTSKTATVRYATAGGTASPPADYAPVSGQLSFPKGTTQRQVSVTVYGDTTDEANETFVLSLSQATRTKIITSQATGTITDDDLPSVVSIDATSAPEGEVGTNTTMAFPVRLDRPSGLPVTVQYATSPGTASAGSDYTSVAATLTFPPGQTFLTAPVTVLGDGVANEGPETVHVTLSNETNATLGASAADGVILDNDPLTTPNITIADRENTEGATFTFSVVLSQAAATDFLLRYDVVAATAQTPADLPSVFGQALVIPAGRTVVPFDIETTEDAIDELAEDFLVNLRLDDPSFPASIEDGQAIGTMTDDDPEPVVGVGDTAVSEGDTTDTPNFAYFPVHLGAASGLSVTVHYATVDGTAVAGTDYTATVGEVVFPAGSKDDQFVAVPILGNLDDQPDKTFTLQLSSPEFATLGDSVATAVILDDEASPLPTISVDDPTVTEGDSGTFVVPFTVSLSDFSDDVVTVEYAVTSGGTTVVATTELVFEPGDTQLVVPVTIAGNMVPEADVVYELTLSAPANAEVSATDGIGTGTVIDNDAASTANTVSVDDASVVEGDASATVLQFVVSLGAPATSQLTVDYATASWTALAGEDFHPVDETLVFDAGEQTKVVLVAVTADVDAELEEKLLLNLTRASDGLVIADGQAVGTITDDDPASAGFTLSIGDDVVQESASPRTAEFLVTLSAPAPAGGVAFTYATVADTAGAGDFTAVSGPITIPAGEQSATIPVTVLGDAADEPPTERFFVDLATTAPGVAIVRARGVGTILDNQGLLPVVTIGEVTVHDGPTPGTVVVTIPVTLDEPNADQDVVVYYSIPSPTGGAPIVGQVTIPMGSTSGVATHVVTGELEAVAGAPVTITDADGAVIDPSGGSTSPVIVPVASIDQVVVTEGPTPGTSVVEVTVGLDRPSDEDTTVVVTVPSPVGGVDPTITIVIPAGETTGTGQVEVDGSPDDVADAPVEITQVTGGVESPTGGAATPTVVDVPLVAIDEVVVNPGSTPGTSIVVVTVTLDEPSATDVIVEFTVPSATGGDPTVGTIVIPAGQTTATGEVVVQGDPGAVDDNAVALTDATGAVIDPSGSSATPTPVDLPIVAIGDVTVTDGGTPGQVVVVIPITLDEASTVPVTVTYSIPSTTGGAPTVGTVTFPPGSTSETVQVTVPGTTGQVAGSTVTLTDADGAVLDPADRGDTPAVVDLPVVTIGDVTVSPGAQPGTVVVTVPVTIDQPATGTITVEYTVPSTSGGAPTTGTITIAPGATSGVGTVTVPGNTTTAVPGPITLTDSTGSVIDVADASDAPTVASPTSGGTGLAAAGSGGAAGATKSLPRSTKVATGYRMVASDGGIFTFGDAPFLGSTGDIKLNKPIVGMATTPSGDGYWLVATDGGIFTFGDAGFFGSTGNLRLNRPIVGMETTPSGKGYWLVADDGGIFAFGDAEFQGSTGALRLNKPIVGMETTPSGQGYWLVATDGGIFAFGDAEFLGSTGALRLNKPIVGMAASPSGSGYRLVATDGGIFAFGDAEFLGSTGDIRLNQPIVGMAASPTGAGYWLVATDGGVFTFGDARFLGSTGDIRLNQPINGMAPVLRTGSAG